MTPYRTTIALKGHAYACSSTSKPTRAARAILWKNTKRSIRPSWPYQCVAVLATTMLCASIILPITPPELFAAAMSVGLTPTYVAEMVWRLPKSTLDDVSEPVSATPNQPSMAPKNG